MILTPVLFIHAFPLDSRMWRPQLERLRRDAPERPVLAPDLRGLGQRRAGELPESVDQHARDMLAELDQRGVTRAFVVGLSMGGYVALAMHRLAPERIAGLLLANTRANADTDEQRQTRAEQAARLRREGVAFVPDQYIPVLVGPTCPQVIKLELRRLMLEQEPQGVAAALGVLASRPDATAELGSIQVPTAVIGAEHDQPSPPAVVRELAAGIGGAALTIIGGVGHLSNLEAPDEFNAALVAALALVDGEQGGGLGARGPGAGGRGAGRGLGGERR